MKTRTCSKKTQRAKRRTTTTTPLSTTVVMDVLPWPNGCGFAGGDNWWRQVLSQGECERLNNLIGLALLDSCVCERLVTKRDPALFTAFGLSVRTQNWLSGINATTLKELAQAIVAGTHLFYVDSAAADAA